MIWGMVERASLWEMVPIDILVSIALPMWLDKIKKDPDVTFMLWNPPKRFIDPAAPYLPHIQIAFFLNYPIYDVMMDIFDQSVFTSFEWLEWSS